MKLKHVHIDEENRIFGARILNVDGKFSTPYRIPSSVEYGSKQKLPTVKKIDSDISEVTINFRTGEYNQFLNENGPYANRIAQIEERADLMSYSSLISFYPQLPRSITPNKKAMWLLLQLGLDANGVNIVSIPDFEPQKSYELDLQNYCEGIRAYRKEPMPILDMGLHPDEFRKKFDEIVSNSETDLVKIIGLIYRNYRKNIQNYYYVWENKSKKILYYCLDVQRKFENQAATMHILQSFGIDVYSTRFMRGGGGNKQKRLIDIDIFDKTTMGILKFNEYVHEHPDHDLNCNCPICGGRTLDEFVDRYGYNHEGDFDGHQLQYAGKIHEYYSSTNEFDLSREFIREDSLLKYFSSKKYLESQKREDNTAYLI
jgi:hypothetical protein